MILDSLNSTVFLVHLVVLYTTHFILTFFFVLAADVYSQYFCDFLWILWMAFCHWPSWSLLFLATVMNGWVLRAGLLCISSDTVNQNHFQWSDHLSATSGILKNELMADVFGLSPYSHILQFVIAFAFTAGCLRLLWFLNTVRYWYFTR